MAGAHLAGTDDRRRHNAAIRARKLALLSWLTTPDPSAPCPVCTAGAWWRHWTGGPWRCRRCDPPPDLARCRTLITADHRPPAAPRVRAAELHRRHGEAITLPDGRRRPATSHYLAGLPRSEPALWPQAPRHCDQYQRGTPT